MAADRDALNRLLDYIDHLDSVGALTGAVSERLRSLIREIEQMTPDEGWLPVVGWPAYKVSNFGRVRSLDRIFVNSLGHESRLVGVVLKSKIDRYGYPVVQLYEGSRKKRVTRAVHSLMAEAFIGPRPDGMEVCHGDGNPANNLLANLRYGTPSDNGLDRVRHGRNQHALKTHCPQNHILAAPNLVQGVLRRGGGRQCVACGRARNWLRRHPGKSFEELADKYYAELLSQVEVGA